MEGRRTSMVRELGTAILVAAALALTGRLFAQEPPPPEPQPQPSPSGPPTCAPGAICQSTSSFSSR